MVELVGEPVLVLGVTLVQSDVGVECIGQTVTCGEGTCRDFNTQCVFPPVQYLSRKHKFSDIDYKNQ